MTENVLVRYIVLEDSVVDKVEGPLAAEGSFTLSQRDLHRWNGLFLNNVTIHSLGSSSFNLTHKVKHTHTHTHTHTHNRYNVWRRDSG
ncbi:hypothetical protein E2C01_092485 [Portunus trituberculatus]|uniref:Uncharacterized protein n=1 Tax=Portunus trituberculatus TaxID=210409 RepID=A0A5B7JRI0_PORTR|nr:hypothetical protein [Portunus trituberculatus]